jgi:N-methylhydantoinase B
MLAILPTLAGDIPWAAGGLMRCFDIVTPEGTLNNATFPAAVNKAPIATAWAIGNLAAQCLSQMLERTVELAGSAQATCCGTWNTAIVAGLDERGPQPVPFLDVVMEMMAGGYGARPTADGMDTGGLFCIPMGRVPDAEMTELLYPVLMLWRREEADSGGPGRTRGGASASVAITPHGTSIPAGVVLSSSGMATAQNQGLAGGYPGNTGHNVIVRGSPLTERFAAGEIPTSIDDLGGTPEIAQVMAASYLAPGDVLYLHCQGGGGYGDPLRRDPRAVARDLADGKITSAACEQVYGVVVQEGGQVDVTATEARRAELLVEREAQATPPPVRLDESFAPADVIPADDNLAFARRGGGQVTVCRHCGQRLSTDDGTLALARRDAPPGAAGPGVTSDASHYVDTDVVFRQYLCPGCFTCVASGLVPREHTDVIHGMAVAVAG